MPTSDTSGRESCDPALFVQSRLDRAVIAGWLERALAVGATMAGGIAVTVAAGAAGDLWAPGTGRHWRWAAAIVGGGLAGAALTVSIARSRRCDPAGVRLDRLGVAIATERHHPWLDERVSRALGFLEETAAVRTGLGAIRAVVDADRPPPADAALTAGLRRLAVAQAAEALERVPVLAVPGAAARRWWIAAGLVTAATVAASAWAGPRAWQTAIRGQIFPATAADTAADTAAATPVVSASTDPAAAIAVVRQAVYAIRVALGEGAPPPDERRLSLATRARAAAAAADVALAGRPADEVGALLPLLTAGLGDVAASLSATSGPPGVGVPRARVVLTHLAAALTAADRLAATAAVETRLAAVLSRAFARGPGVSAYDLPDDVQAGLDRLAEIAAECRTTAAADAHAIRVAFDAIVPEAPAVHLEAVTTVVRRGCDRLDDVAVDATATLPGHVAANRLGLAGAIAAEAAGGIAALAVALGVKPSDGQPASSGGRPPRAPSVAAAGPDAEALGAPLSGPLDRTQARLDRVADTILAPLDRATASIGGATGVGGLGEQTSRAATPEAAGDVTAAGDVPDGGTRSMAAAAAPSAAERVWMLLPRQQRPDTAAHAAEGGPAAYRAAVDAYYRLLFQSLARPAARDADRTAIPPAVTP